VENNADIKGLRGLAVTTLPGASRSFNQALGWLCLVCTWSKLICYTADKRYV